MYQLPNLTHYDPDHAVIKDHRRVTLTNVIFVCPGESSCSIVLKPAPDENKTLPLHLWNFVLLDLLSNGCTSYSYLYSFRTVVLKVGSGDTQGSVKHSQEIHYYYYCYYYFVTVMGITTHVIRVITFMGPSTNVNWNGGKFRNTKCCGSRRRLFAPRRPGCPDSRPNGTV